MSPDFEGVLDRSEYRMLLGEADKLYCKNKVLKGRFLPHVPLLRLDLPLLKLQSSPTKNTEHVSPHRNRHYRGIWLQCSPHDSAGRRLL